MKKLCLTGVKAMLSLSCALALGVSCVNEEYDMSGDNLNLEVTVFENGLTLPLGSTEQIKLQDLLKDADWNALQVGADGEYYVKYEDSFNIGSGLPDFSDFVKIPNVDFVQTLAFTLPEIDIPDVNIPGLVIPDVVLDGLEASVKESVEVEFLSAGALSKEVVSLGTVTLDNTYLTVNFDASSVLPKLGSAVLTMDFEVKIPEMIRLEGQKTGVLKLTGKADDKGIIKVDPIKVESLDINKSAAELAKGLKDVVEIEGILKLDNVTVDSYELVKNGIELGFNVGLKNASASKKHIDVKKISAKVDYKLAPVNERITLDGLSDLFGSLGDDASLNLYSAVFAFEAVTNLGIPVIVDVDLVPFVDGRAEESKAVSATIPMNYSESADKDAVTKYSFNEDEILDLIGTVPEMIEIRVNAYTDENKEASVEPSADYKLEADYLAEIPLEFGEGFKVNYKTEDINLPPVVGTLLKGGSKIMLTGKVQNTIPLGIDLKLNFKDSNGTVVPLSEGAGVQSIAACKSVGSAAVTDLAVTIALKQEAKVKDITSLELVLNLNSEGAEGVPVTENAYLQADLKVVLPEGITIDLGEISNEE